jgi:preprotein translocase subunit YajC
MSFFVSNAWADGAAAAAGAPPGGSAIMSLLLPLVFVGVFYFLLIRPQSKRQKEHKQLVDSLAKGDEIVTTGGIAGRIVDLGDNFVLVEMAEGVQVKVRRGAIETVLPKGSLKEL